MSDDMNEVIRRAAGFVPDDTSEQGDTSPPAFDGGARTPAAPPPPSMSDWLRAAVLSQTDGLPMDLAMRQVRFEQKLEN